MAEKYTEDRFWEIANNAIFPYIRSHFHLDGGVYEIQAENITQKDIEWALNTMFENAMIQESGTEGVYTLTDVGKEFCPVQKPVADGTEQLEHDDEDALILNMIFGTFLFYRQNPIKSTSIDLMKYKRGYEHLNPKTKSDVRRIEEGIHRIMNDLKEKGIVTIEEGSKENIDLNAPTIPDLVTLLSYDSLPPQLHQEYLDIKPLMDKEAAIHEVLGFNLQESYERDRKKIFMGKDVTIYNEKLDALMDKYQGIMDRNKREGNDEAAFIIELPEELQEEYQEKSKSVMRRNEHDEAQEKIAKLRALYLEKADELRIMREKKQSSILYKTTHLFNKKKSS
jgi:hypothetical protein